jgi:2-C-methyl-D-erythritol 2,4-cyclodiphosphate synthase
MKIGSGIDSHQLVSGRPLRLGGIEIPFDRGLEGHSDGDVLLHSVASALLGALGDGDLGRHFPSSDATLEGIDSRAILSRVATRVHDAGYALGNLDATIIAQAPRLASHTAAMEVVIAGLLDVATDRVNVKVTSTDRLGAIGRGEGIAAQAVVLLEARSEDRT